MSQHNAKKPRLFHLVSQAQLNMFRSGDRIFRSALGYSGTQVVALFAIKSEEGCLMKDLGRQLELQNSAVTGLVTRMLDNGLIVRKPCEIDGRASRLYLSELGDSVLTKAQPLLKAMNAQLTADFTEAEIATVVRFLQHAIAINFT